MASHPTVTPDKVSTITNKEKELTGSNDPVKGGPAAQAQKHAGEPLDGQVVSDIAKGEKEVTGDPSPAQGGAASIAQSMATKGAETSNAAADIDTSTSTPGVLDAETISKITAKEKEITGEKVPVKGGPTAQAQKHAGEAITSTVLHDITEGEKKVTGGERIKGGPTATAQSELGKSRT